jgi:hypothetical protein
VILFSGCIVHLFTITDAVFCTDIVDDMPMGEGEIFPDAGTVYCWLQYAHAPEDTRIKAVWYYEGEIMYEKTAVVQGNGAVWFGISSTGQYLPQGTYTVEISAEDQIQREMTFSIPQ